MNLRAKLREEYEVLFGQEWPVWIGGLLYGVINVFMFLFYQPWTTLDGALNWGDWVLGGLGVIKAEALSPLLRSGSVVNLGLLFGAMAAALLAGQFGIRVGPVRELVKGLIGGILLGLGAAVARGCNLGGFFSATAAFSASGLTMGAGLAGGAFLGTRYLLWETEILSRRGAGAAGDAARPLAPRGDRQRFLGVALLLALLLAAAAYGQAGYDDRAVILLFGILLGVVSQRSRICFARGFREPFATGESSHTRAMLLAILVSMIGFAIVKTVVMDKADDFVRPTFWLGSLLGGVIFGVGMVLAGGCGGGTLWRAGEGHVKLWVALAGYVFAASFARDALVRSGLQAKLGTAVFLPEAAGSWTAAILLMLAILAVWYLVARWNEVTGKFAAF